MTKPKFSDYDKPITLADVEILRSIGRKSVNDFTADEIEISYHNKKLPVNKQMVKAGINDIPKLYGLLDAINKKESSSQYLADLQQIRKAYVQDVKENYSNSSILDPSEKINTSDENSSKNVDSGGRAALKTGKKVDRATVKLKAEYKTDRVFSQAEIDNMLRNNILFIG